MSVIYYANRKMLYLYFIIELYLYFIIEMYGYFDAYLNQTSSHTISLLLPHILNSTDNLNTATRCYNDRTNNPNIKW